MGDITLLVTHRYPVQIEVGVVLEQNVWHPETNKPTHKKRENPADGARPKWILLRIDLNV
jgi:hypothetical protein